MAGLRWAAVVALALSAGVANPTPSAPRIEQRPMLERPQAGWIVASRSARGVMVDYRNVKVGDVTFRALRLRARSTLLRWHAGSTDPTPASLPPDAASSIDWASEGRAGVVAVFNGAFKAAAGSGGAMVDGLVLSTLQRDRMTIAIDAAGHWAMGLWGAANFPPRGFRPISLRQNLGPLVWNGRVTPAARSSDWRQWGDPLHEVPTVARTALGVNRAGDLIYVATMQPTLAGPLAQALVALGAVTGMELDINPYWPILGAPFAPLHRAGPMPVQLPDSMHSPTIYETGWQRDFFVALAEPSSWRCWWTSPGLRGPGLQPQPLHQAGPGCSSSARSSEPATTVGPTSTSTTSSVATTTAATPSVTAPASP